MIMKIDGFDTDKDVLVIAEIGNNHEGSFSCAKKMVKLAAKAGADAVKFQTYRTESFISPGDEKRFRKLKSFELAYGEFRKLSDCARSEGLLFMSTPFDLESVKFLDGIVPAFKISSGDNNFYPLIRAVAQTGKPVLLSGGLADVKQLGASQSLIQRTWRKEGTKQEMAILHCVSGYPVPPGEVNLSVITRLMKEFDCVIGYSDHTIGIDAAILAVALGARIIEKHFTLDKNYSDFRDHQLSADPDEMACMVKKIRMASSLLGKGVKEMQECEKEVAGAIRRSIVAVRDLAAGQRLSRDDITWMRPGGGLPPGDERFVVGKVLSRPVKKGGYITKKIMRQGAA